MNRMKTKIFIQALAITYLAILSTAKSFAGANDSYDGAEIQTPVSQYFEEGDTYLIEWVGRPAPGETAVTLFSLYDQSSPWSEITFETFGGGANGSTDAFQTQYITDGGRQHVVYHTTPDIYDGGFHTFSIVYRPSSDSEPALIEWLIDGDLIRRVEGGDADVLDNTMRIHAAVWKVYDGKWGSYGTTQLADSTVASVKQIRRSVLVGENWNQEVYWDFSDDQSLSPWTLSHWSFSHFQGDYVPENAQIVNGTLHLVLSKQGVSNSLCTLTDGMNYAVENVNSGRFFDVRDKGTTNGSELQQWGTTVAGNQRVFTAVDMGEGYWGFKNVGAGLFLDIEGGVSAINDKRVLQLWGTSASATNRQFALVEGEHGGCELRPRHTLEAGVGKCLGVQGASGQDGASVIQYSCNTSADQEWLFISQ